MSGSGRKSQYRKQVATDFLDDSRTPEPSEKIVVVLGNRGDNTFEIRMESDDRLSEATEETAADAPAVVEPTENTAQFTIRHILSKPNIKFLKLKNLWPAGLDNVASVETVAVTPAVGGAKVGRDNDIMPYEEEGEYEDGEYEEEEEEVLYDSKGNTIEK